MRIGTLLTADNAMLRQELGTNKFVLLGEISDADGLGRWKARPGGERRSADSVAVRTAPSFQPTPAINRRSDVSGRY